MSRDTYLDLALLMFATVVALVAFVTLMIYWCPAGD